MDHDALNLIASTSPSCLQSKKVAHRQSTTPHLLNPPPRSLANTLPTSSPLTYSGEVNFTTGIPQGEGACLWGNGDSFQGTFDDHPLEGTYESNEGKVKYIGSFNSSGQFHGLNSTLLLKDEATYRGEMKNGLKDGIGYEASLDGSIYEGEYRLGKRSGVGKIVFGNAANNHSGKNSLTNNNGTTNLASAFAYHSYEGEWFNNTPHGTGTAYSADKSTFYSGGFKRSLFSGDGILQGVNEVYKGEFIQGMKSGNGSIYSSITNTTIEGEFRLGEPLDAQSWTIKYHSPPSTSTATSSSSSSSSSPRWTTSPASVYSGSCVSGKANGFGIMKYAITNDVYSGSWANGLRHGDGICVFGGGGEYQGVWRYDKPVGLLLGGFDDFDLGGKDDGAGEGEGWYDVDVDEDEKEKEVVDDLKSDVKKKKDDEMNKNEGKSDVVPIAINAQVAFRYKNGDTYKGKFDASGLRTGFGEYKSLHSESTYIGSFEHGSRHGINAEFEGQGFKYFGSFEKDNFKRGTLILKDENITFIGQFNVNGEFHGLGRLVDNSTDETFVGNFKDGLKSGKGRLTTLLDGGDLLVYEGVFCEGRKEGCAILSKKKNIKAVDNNMDVEVVYEGFFKDGVFHGEGVLTGEGFTFEGGFVLGLFGGFGKFTDSNRVVEGEWSRGRVVVGSDALVSNLTEGWKYQGTVDDDGIPDGEGGMIKYSNPEDVYIGPFVKGEREGVSGICLYANGERYKGGWEKDTFAGAGELKLPNGQVYLFS